MSFDRKLFIDECTTQGKSITYIEKTLNYADKLSANGLPILFSLKHLALELNIEYHELLVIEKNRDRYYKHFEVKKKKGGTRFLSVPYSNLKMIQSWIYHNILKNQASTASAFGYVKDKSIKQNAQQHQNKKFILNIDLLKFFETITEHKVYKLFIELGYTRTLAWSLSRLVTVPISEDYYLNLSLKEKKLFQKTFENEFGVLPQGAPTSPSISNLILRNLDKKLVELAELNGCLYTRYADDITISSDKKENIPIKAKVLEIIQSEKLLINWNKWSLSRNGTCQKVTGLNVTHGVTVPKSYRKDVKRHLHFCLKNGPENHQKRIGNNKQFYKYWLLGRIQYIRHINPEIGKKLLQDFNNIQWPL